MFHAVGTHRLDRAPPLGGKCEPALCVSDLTASTADALMAPIFNMDYSWGHKTMPGISSLRTISSYLWQMNAEDKIRDSFNEHVMANPIIGGWKKMKKEGHPAYYQTKVTCGCGNTFVTGGTRPELVVDICSACHPFYTGKLKYVDTAGRIEKFKSKFASGNYASLQTKKKKGKS